MHFVLKGRILSLDQQAGIVGDDVAQRLDPGPLALGEILQHVGFHQFLVAGMADAKAHAAIVVADMLGDRTQAIVAGIAAAELHPNFAGRQFGLIVQHHDAAGFQLVEIQRIRHRASRTRS